ncbi:MAG: type II CAAX endopeptidase family protein [Bacteroidia bacterium]
MDDSNQPARPLFTFGPGMRVMLLVALCFACMGIYELFAFAMPDLVSNLSANHPDLLGVFQNILIFALPAIVYVNVFPLERFGYLRLNKSVSPVTVLFGVIGLVVLIPAMDFGAMAIRQSITNPELITFIETLEKSNDAAYQMPTFGSFLACLLFNALVPAFCEELLFRGGIQQILMERSRNRAFPIIISALIFTLFHANPTQLPFIFLSGLILGYAFYRTGSLRTSLIMHFFFNGTALFLEYLAQHNAAVRSWMPGALVTVIAVVVSAAFLYLLWRKTEKSKI